MKRRMLWAGVLKTEARISRLCKLKKVKVGSKSRKQTWKLKRGKGREENVIIAVPLKCDLISGLGKSKTYVSAQPSTTGKRLTAKKGETNCLSIEIAQISLELYIKHVMKLGQAKKLSVYREEKWMSTMRIYKHMSIISSFYRGLAKRLTPKSFPHRG